MSEYIAKREFLAGRICPTYGWLEHRAEAEPLSPGIEWKFHFGREIGERARTALGSGPLLPIGPLDSAAKATRDEMSNPDVSIMYEPTFLANTFVARADALRRRDGGWELIEVKSGKSPDEGEKVKDEYLDDIAFTAFVATSAGVVVNRATLVLVNRDYRLNGPAQMFVDVDVTDEVLTRARLFDLAAPSIADATLAAEKPTPSLIFECKDCPHFPECVGAGMDDHIFVLPRLSAKRFDELRHHERISKLPPGTKLTPTQQRIADVILSREPLVESDGLKILADVSWPAYYLDFEAVMPPLPWFEESPPYEAVPFQYSLDRCDGLDCEPEHFEYLAPVEGDWRRDMTVQLLGHLGTTGSIVVYSAYEKTRLNALAKLFPDLQAPIEAVVERLFDLERVFKCGYCHPGFAGRTSIKKVLPVMVPTLTYSSLQIANGDDALGTFSLMRVGKYSVDTHESHRENLLKYCGLDTRAMVELHRAVAGLVQ